MGGGWYSNHRGNARSLSSLINVLFFREVNIKCLTYPLVKWKKIQNRILDLISIRILKISTVQPGNKKKGRRSRKSTWRDLNREIRGRGKKGEGARAGGIEERNSGATGSGKVWGRRDHVPGVPLIEVTWLVPFPGQSWENPLGLTSWVANQTVGANDFLECLPHAAVVPSLRPEAGPMQWPQRSRPTKELVPFVLLNV